VWEIGLSPQGQLVPLGSFADEPLHIHRSQKHMLRWNVAVYTSQLQHGGPRSTPVFARLGSLHVRDLLGRESGCSGDETILGTEHGEVVSGREISKGKCARRFSSPIKDGGWTIASSCSRHRTCRIPGPARVTSAIGSKGTSLVEGRSGKL